MNVTSSINDIVADKRQESTAQRCSTKYMVLHAADHGDRALLTAPITTPPTIMSATFTVTATSTSESCVSDEDDGVKANCTSTGASSRNSCPEKRSTQRLLLLSLHTIHHDQVNDALSRSVNWQINTRTKEMEHTQAREKNRTANYSANAPLCMRRVGELALYVVPLRLTC